METIRKIRNAHHRDHKVDPPDCQGHERVLSRNTVRTILRVRRDGVALRAQDPAGAEAGGVQGLADQATGRRRPQAEEAATPRSSKQGKIAGESEPGKATKTDPLGWVKIGRRWWVNIQCRLTVQSFLFKR